MNIHEVNKYVWVFMTFEIAGLTTCTQRCVICFHSKFVIVCWSVFFLVVSVCFHSGLYWHGNVGIQQSIATNQSALLSSFHTNSNIISTKTDTVFESKHRNLRAYVNIALFYNQQTNSYEKWIMFLHFSSEYRSRSWQLLSK